MSGVFLGKRALAVVVAFGLAACSSDDEHTVTVDGSARGSGGVTGASASSGGVAGSATSSGGTSPNAGAPATGSASGVECRTTADCPQTNCFGCPGSTCVSGRCVTATSTGAGGSPGAGGMAGGGTSGASLGTVSIVFTVTGTETYCSAGCVGPSFINIRNPAGEWLTLSSACSAPCDTCRLSCPPGACAPPAAVTGGSLDWTGAYLTDSTCGAGMACKKPAFAAKGKYTAEFCATPGTMIHPDGGAAYCKQSGTQKCTTVDFDYPTTSTVKGTLGM